MFLDATSPVSKVSPNEIVQALTSGPVTVERINKLIAAHTEQLSRSDDKGALPLHYACGANHNGIIGHRQSYDVIKALLEAYPATAEVKDRDNMTPLHFALWEGYSSEIVKMLFDSYPAAAEAKDSNNKTPLHWALEKRASEIVMMLLKLEK